MCTVHSPFSLEYDKDKEEDEDTIGAAVFLWLCHQDH